MLSDTERTFLLTSARSSLTAAVLQTLFVPIAPPTAQLKEPRGAFVSLHHGGALCGCIGYVDPLCSLAETVERAARKAGTEDSRFDPVTPPELPLILIEISVLSVPEQLEGPEELEIGKHGVLLESGRRRGVFLPQVAPQFGWDAIVLLNHVAEKAGLPSDAWKRPGAVLYKFTAEIIQECAPMARRA